MLRCQSVVLGIVTIATLPGVCLSARSVMWPSTEKHFSEGARNRKGLRHSPGVLMDVMRTPTSVRPAGFAWIHGDQIGSFSGGHLPHRHPSSHKANPVNNLIINKIENTRRKPYATFKEHTSHRTRAPTLNFAPANAIPWHMSGHTNYANSMQPSAVWRFVPFSMEPEQTTTPSPQPRETQTVFRYAPTGTEEPASFTTSGTPKKARHHVRLFTNAHQYKRDMDASSTAPTMRKPPPLPTDTTQSAKIFVDANSIDEEHKKSPWFKQLLGQVLAAAEMTNH